MKTLGGFRNFGFCPLQHIDSTMRRQDGSSAVVVASAPIRAEVNATLGHGHERMAMDAEAGTGAGFVDPIDLSKHRPLIRFDVASFKGREDRPVRSLPSLPFAMSGVPIHSGALSPDNPQLANRNNLFGINPTAPQKRTECETRSMVNGGLCILVYVIAQEAPRRSQFQQLEVTTNYLSDDRPLATFSPMESAA
jgi:hypothetical protein